MSLNYYIENGRVVSGNDLGPQHDQPMTQRDCKNFYFSHSPMGWYNDLGAETIGLRPVWKPFRVGDTTPNTPNNYVQPGNFGCKQPCWTKECK